MKNTPEEVWRFITHDASVATLLPSWVLSLKDSTASELIERQELNIEAKEVSASYLQFLNEQISLEPRGPEWTQILTKRLNSLAPFEGKRIIIALISKPDSSVIVKVDPTENRLISVEEN
jgi:hypothetical protein